MAEWQKGNGGTAERMAEWQNGRNGYIRTIYGRHTPVEWWNGGMVEWRNGGMAEWRNGGMVIEWRNGRMVIEWRNGRMAEWRNGGMAEWCNGGMAEWRNGNRSAEWRNGNRMAEMVEWWNGGMAEWWNGGMAEWRNGGMAEWRNCGMVEWWNGGRAERQNCGMAEWQNGGIADGRANCRMAAILIILWFSQYHKLIIFCTTNMVTNKSVAGKPAAISKKSPIKVTTPPKSPNPYNTSPKKNADEKKKSHNIIPLVDNNDTPYGWAFENFYNAKDFVKDLSNRNAALIFLGGLEFKSFSNLTTRWVKSSLVGGCLWVIHIDKTMDETSGCFPMEAHIAYAKKLLEL